MLRKLRSFIALPVSRVFVASVAHRTRWVGVTSLILAGVTLTPRRTLKSRATSRFSASILLAGPNNYLSTRGARMDGKMVWSVGLFANYNYLPFQVQSCEAPRRF